MYSVYLALVALPYEADVQDCSNKAGRYARCLIDAHDLPAVVVVVEQPKTGICHAIVRVTYRRRDWYVDPTGGVISRKLAPHGTLLYTVSKEELYTNPEFR